jgi:putative FmdB family regulatory protein
MPIYEYLCKKCGEFEIMQKINERPLSRCPTCHTKVTKLISNSSFQLKGSGWYVTDYARKGMSGKDTPTKDTPTKDKAESKSEPSSSKTEATASPSETGTTKSSETATA